MLVIILRLSRNFKTRLKRSDPYYQANNTPIVVYRHNKPSYVKIIKHNRPRENNNFATRTQSLQYTRDASIIIVIFPVVEGAVFGLTKLMIANNENIARAGLIIVVLFIRRPTYIRQVRWWLQVVVLTTVTLHRVFIIITFVYAYIRCLFCALDTGRQQRIIRLGVLGLKPYTAHTVCIWHPLERVTDKGSYQDTQAVKILTFVLLLYSIYFIANFVLCARS